MKKTMVTVPVSDTCERKNRYIDYGYPVSLSNLDYTSLEDVAHEIKNLQKEHGDGYESLHLRLQNNCGCWGSCCCDPSLVLFGTREENDLEKELRLEREKEDKERQELRDKKEFERLKNKFK